MPGFSVLHEPDPAQIAGREDQLVDIVAVHDAYEDSSTAWTHPETGINWLQELLPQQIKICRIVSYSYDTPVASFFADDAADNVQRLAESLVQQLRADRQLAGCVRRPIIFVCHGLGGVLVKKSLIYSSTRTAPKVVPLWDQFISTFAIFFFGTPHGKANQSNWLALERLARQKGEKRRTLFHAAEQFRSVGHGHAQVPQSVDTEFSPLARQFHMFYFWEGLPTSLGGHSDYIVTYESAAPNVDNAEKAGIHASHPNMVKFASMHSSDYRTALASLQYYCEKAPQIIAHRWNQADIALQERRAGEAWELGGFGFDVHLEIPFRSSNTVNNRHLHLPKEATTHFIGREDMLESLKAALLPGGSTRTSPGRKSFVIYGMGGSGKTELCSNFASHHKHRYTAVFTIRAASPKTISDSFSQIGELAELEPTERAGRHFLDQLTSPWLLIIDNADEPSLDLTSLFPMSDVAHIVITTRNPDFRQIGTLGHLELKGLKDNEALQLLLTKAQIPRPWDGSTKDSGMGIARMLGCLAIALIQAGTCIYRGVCDIRNYLGIYEEARKDWRQRRASQTQIDGINDRERDIVQETSQDRDVENGKRTQKDSDIIKAVYSAFDVSLEYLHKHSARSKDATDLLNILAYYHFDQIPREIFSRAVKNRAKDLGTAPRRFSLASLTGSISKRFEPPKLLPGFLNEKNGNLDEYRANWAISELQSLSLITFDGRYISMHPLVKSWVQDRISKQEQKYWATVAFHTLMEAISLPPQGNSETDGDFHREILPHLETCMKESGIEQPISLTFNCKGNFHRRVAQVTWSTMFLILRDQTKNSAKCGWVYAERGKFKEARRHLQATRETLVQVLGEDNDKTLTATRALAGIYWGLDKPGDAIILQRRVVNIQKARLGPLHEETLRAMNDLGKSYWLHGCYEEALELQTVTAERMKAIFRPPDPRYKDTLAAMDGLGVTLGSWRRYQESLEIHQQVLSARSRIIGDTHLDTLSTSSNVAMALLDLGRLEEAESRMTHVYEQRQLQLGKEHPWTLWALVYVAKVHIAAGRLSEAEEILLWGIGAGIRSLDEKHVGVAMGRGELARVYARQGRFDEAERMTLLALNKLEESRDVAQYDIVHGGFQLAQLYMIRGKREAAVQCCQRALHRADMRLGRTHPLGQDLVEMLRVLVDPSVLRSDLTKLVPASKQAGELVRPNVLILEEKRPLSAKLSKTSTW